MSNVEKERQFEQMVREHRSTIYTICYMFSKDQDEVSDLFQEVLINLWKSFDSFEGRSKVNSWIYRISLNVCISLDRKKRRHRTEPLVMDINPFEETTATRGRWKCYASELDGWELLTAPSSCSGLRT